MYAIIEQLLGNITSGRQQGLNEVGKRRIKVKGTENNEATTLTQNRYLCGRAGRLAKTTKDQEIHSPFTHHC
jgi:hypothetical protein